MSGSQWFLPVCQSLGQRYENSLLYKRLVILFVFKTIGLYVPACLRQVLGCTAIVLPNPGIENFVRFQRVSWMTGREEISKQIVANESFAQLHNTGRVKL